MKSLRLLPTATVVALAVVVALPVAFVLLQAVFPHLAQGSLRAPFSAVWPTLSHSDTLPLVTNTLRLGLSVALGTALVGGALGAVRGLFHVPGARLWDLCFLLPFLVPPYLAALGWMLLLQTGGYAQQLTGLDAGRFLFSLPGLVFVMTLNIFPVVYFAVSRALATTGSRLADVARVHGASAWRAFLRVTLPLALPAFAASLLLAFTMAIEEFGAPAALGARAGFSVLVTSIEGRFADWPIDLPGASILSVVLAVLALFAFVLQHRLAAGKDFETQTGKPIASPPRALGRWTVPVMLGFGAVALLATAAPLFSILATAFSGTLSGGLSIANLTTAHFTALLGQGAEGLEALATSLSLALGTSLVTGVLGFLCAWCVVKSTMRGRVLIDGLSLLPHALPGIVVGVGLILAWNLPFWPVTPYNTWGILLLSYCCLLLPYPVRYTSAALRQMAASLEAAARVHGAPAGVTLRRITLPLVMPALGASLMIVFAIASRELVTSLLLAPSGVQTVSIFVWRQFEQGSIGQGMAMGVVSMAVSGTLLMLASLLGSKRESTA
ncbi:ABC transporter permease [Pandoraea capi]|uniref:ABC transporter permease n=1 Tax=Pandoraea capi TaxID=2508286 RepID=A0ABY6W9Z0_9BURK|nr:iron ABC transporter permease [Pandoraea capi]VVE37027.1 ABC transporter permease [Pandoraea capi]